ncbi:hypothetical protein HK096_007522, partial [Nowakowskiella sp. JEL0078]
MKTYFSSLGEIVKSESPNAPLRTLTKFNQLMLTAYREFQTVSHEQIITYRKSHQLSVIHGLSLYAHKSLIRNLTYSYKFTKDELLYICTTYFNALFYNKPTSLAADLPKAPIGPLIDYPVFRKVFQGFAKWADDDLTPASAPTLNTSAPLPTPFLKRLYDHVFDRNHDGAIDFQDLVTGLYTLKTLDTLTSVDLIFRLHDTDGDGKLGHEDMIAVSESLLWLLRRGDPDTYLAAVGGLLHRGVGEESLGVGIFSEMVLGDPFLEQWFATGLAGSVKLDGVQVVEEKVEFGGAKEMVDGLVKEGWKWAKGVGGKRGRRASVAKIERRASLKPVEGVVGPGGVIVIGEVIEEMDEVVEGEEAEDDGEDDDEDEDEDEEDDEDQ